MKNPILPIALFFSFFFLQFQSFGQGNGWEWQNPKPQGNELTAIQFIDSLNGWAVALGGSVIKTTDGGITWTLKRTGTTSDLRKCQFLDAQTGWVVAWNGEIIKTIDGGATWANQTVGLNDWKYPSLHFLNESSGWAVGLGGKIFNTLDGGSTWTLKNNGVDSTYLSDVFFLNSQLGWVVSDSGFIYKTTDGGNTWIKHTTILDVGRYSIQFTDAQNGWALSSQGVFRTTNGGTSWTDLTLNVALNPSPTDITFFNSQEGWCSTLNGIFKTYDGGNTWTPVSGFISSSLFCALNMQQSWSVDIFKGKMIRTFDGGNVWQVLDSGYRANLNSVYFTNNQAGWAVGGFQVWESKGSILKTENGGITWTKQTGNWPFLRKISFITPQSGFIVGDSGTILKSTNAGVTWNVRNSGTLKPLNDVRFIDPQTGWIVGDEGIILKTSDGGETWNIQSPGTSNDFYSVYFLDSQNGWIAGYSNLKTTDGGNTWQNYNINSFNGSFLSSIWFTSSQIGIATGQNGLIIRTTNGGTTWNLIHYDFGYVFMNIQFLTDQIGFVSGGELLSTIDGGQTWNIISPQSGQSYAFFTDPFNGWSVSGNSSILHTSTGGVTPIHKTIVSSPSFSIYPNPAEESFQIAAKGNILSVGIVDGLGRRVESVHATSLQNNRLDIRHLKPGIYWVKVQTAEGVSVQKMVKK